MGQLVNKLVPVSTYNQHVIHNSNPWNEKHRNFQRKDPYPFIPFEEPKDTTPKVLLVMALLIVFFLL